MNAPSTNSTFAGRTIVPMKGQSGELPRSDRWVYELKWDGMRLVVYITEDGVRLQSTNGRDVTASFPELQSMRVLADSFNGLILDGEVVAFDGGATPSFNALQRRMHVVDPARGGPTLGDHAGHLCCLRLTPSRWPRHHDPAA